MRTRKEIDLEYSAVVRLYGDRIFKGACLQNEIKALHEKMVQLAQEPASDEAQAPVDNIPNGNSKVE